MMKVKLEFPVKKNWLIGMGFTYVDEVVIRRPTVGDMKGLFWIPPHDHASFMILVSRLTGLPLSVVSEIDLRDYHQIADCINGMWSTGRKR